MRKIYLKFFNHLDFFRIPFSLLREESEKSSTITGKFLSCLIIIYCIFRFATSNAILLENPNTFIRNSYTPSRPHLSFNTSDNFSLVIGINDDKGVYINDISLFNIKAYVFFQNNADLSEKYIDLELRPCEKADFNTNYFDKLRLENAFCLEKNYSLEIFGFWDEKIVQYITIDIQKCVNDTTSNAKCKSEQEITDFLNKNYVQYYITKNYVDLLDFDHPIKSELKGNFYELTSNYMKKCTIYLKKTTLNTEGSLFKEPSIKDTFTVDSINSDVYVTEPYLFSLEVYSSDIEQTIKRKYQTLEEFLGELGGIFNFLFAFGYVFSKIEQKYRLTIFLGNYLMVFQTLRKPNSEKEKNSQKHIFWLEKNSIDRNPNKEIEVLTPKSLNKKQTISVKLENKNIDEISFYEGSKNFDKSVNFSEKHQNNHDLDLKRFSVLKENFRLKNELKFNYFKYLILLMKWKKFCLSSEEKLFLKGQKYIFEEMDIFNILKKSREFEKMKYLLFDRKQTVLFELLQPPIQRKINNTDLSFDEIKNSLEKNNLFPQLNKKILSKFRREALKYAS